MILFYSAIILNCVIFASFTVSGDDLFSTITNTYSVDQNVMKMSGMTTGELIEYHGYKTENFTVQTEDGYVLTIVRCYSPRTSLKSRRAILLIHGMMDTSDTYCMNFGKQSLAYNLADQGYDIYLFNARGNRYSRSHVSRNPNKAGDFWNFSWYELGYFDLPVTIDEILRRTNSTKLSCIGHSQGGTTLLVLLSMRPEYNEKINFVTLLAPFTFMKKVGAPISTVLTAFYLMQQVRNWEFVPHFPQQQNMAQLFCGLFKGIFCNLAINFVLGPSINQRNSSMLPVYLSHFPAGCSSNQLIHFGQELVRQYFGPMMDVNDIEPPSDFPLQNINIPIAVFYSPTDPHTDPEDINMLQASLTNVKGLHIEQVPEFDHIDFVWGINAWDLVYRKIIELDRINTT